LEIVTGDTRIEWLPPTAPAPQPPPPPEPPAPAPRTGLKRAIGPLVALGLILAKLKSVLLFLPKIKVLTTSASMLVSVAAYALIWGWKFAVGFVLLLFVHEMGHVVQLRREGIPASAPLFIPFLGAVVAARSLGGNALAVARVGLAGPVLGTAGALALIPFAEAADSDFLRALAFVGLFLNLFNLLPVLPLDGGRAMAAMAPWMWFVGFGALVVLAFVAPNPILILIVLIGGLETWRRWKQRKAGGEDSAAYYRVKPKHRAIVFAVYVGLIVVCALGMDFTFVERDLDDV
jgi:Zn-dependent protease